MHVDPAQGENLEESLPENLPVRRDDKKVGRENAHLFDERGIQTRGLEYLQAEGKSRFLDGGRRARSPAAGRLVRAGQHSHDEPGNLFQGWNCQGWCSRKENPHQASTFASYPERSRCFFLGSILSMNRIPFKWSNSC